MNSLSTMAKGVVVRIAINQVFSYIGNSTVTNVRIKCHRNTKFLTSQIQWRGERGKFTIPK